MEEVETVRHSDGSTEKIVRQRHGDQTHTTTFRTDKDGHTEKSENFQNMDESKDFVRLLKKCLLYLVQNKGIPL